MKCAFLLDSPDISGGLYVVIEHAIRCNRRGMEIYMVLEHALNDHDLDWHPEARELTWITFDQAVHQNFDIAVATFWKTVYNLSRVKAKVYAYFVQSIETRFYPKKDKSIRKLVESTYALPLKYLTEVNWIKDYLKNNYTTDSTVILNGIRKDIYTPDGEAVKHRQDGKLRVLIEGPLGVSFKNVERTIELCNQSKADEVWLMTSSLVTKRLKVDRVFSRLPISQTPSVYRSCDLLVKLSFVEGMFGPPLEMFHCGGTAIVYDVSGYDEYIRHGENAIVVKTGDEQNVIKSINMLKENDELLQKLKRSASKTASEWQDWEISSLKFENALTEISRSETLLGNKMEILTKLFMDWYVLGESHQSTKGIMNRLLPKGSKRRTFIKNLGHDLMNQKMIKKLLNIDSG